MKSSASLALIAAAAAALSVGVKVALGVAAAHATPALPREEALRRFLVVNAGPVEPVASGWRFTRGACRLQAFPSEARGSLDMVATSHAHGRDRIAFVYRGHVSAERPTFRFGLDVIAHIAAKPFRPSAEPGYVVLIVDGDCPSLPDLPWAQLPA